MNKSLQQFIAVRESRERNASGLGIFLHVNPSCRPLKSWWPSTKSVLCFKCKGNTFGHTKQMVPLSCPQALFIGNTPLWVSWGSTSTIYDVYLAFKEGFLPLNFLYQKFLLQRWQPLGLMSVSLSQLCLSHRRRDLASFLPVPKHLFNACLTSTTLHIQFLCIHLSHHCPFSLVNKDIQTFISSICRGSQ